MASKLPPQFQAALQILKEHFGNESFTVKEAQKVLKEEGNKAGFSFANVREILTKLEKEGFMEKKPSPTDKRRKLYRVKSLFENTEVNKGGTLTRKELFNILKKGADIIRTAVDYKVLPVFLFYKTVSDKYNQLVEDLKKEYEELGEEELYEIANEEFPIKLYDEQKNWLLTWQANQEDNNKFINAIRRLGEINPEKLSRLGFLLTTTAFDNLLEPNKVSILNQLKELF